MFHIMSLEAKPNNGIKDYGKIDYAQGYQPAIDYWMDPSGVMDGVLRSEKPMYVFSSHFHEDHFTKDIFEWKKLREGITYILSKDIYKHRRASKEDAGVWLAKGGIWSDDTISVWALGSTDSGVSCEIVAMDRRLVVKANYDVTQHGLNLNFHKLS